MSTSSQAHTRPAHRANGNRERRHRGRPKNLVEVGTTKACLAPAQTRANNLDEAAAEPEDGIVCWICAESVKFYSVSECNHRTCHVCALRLRALYKRMDCTFCKHPQVTLIFTRSSDDAFDSYTPETIPFKDAKLSISFETQDMMEETLILLRFNCPDPSCDFIAHGWGDLKMHARAIHGKSMCDMCIRYKKVFAHEHVLYQPSQLAFHLPSISHRPSQKSQAPEQVEGGVHPMCEFCRECHFGDDELFAHMRERHEECFLCKRDIIRDQYFIDYDSLERHFNAAHFPCKAAQCQAQKFVVFGSALDLKAHVVEQHGGDMTTRDRKDARRVEAGFDHEATRNRRGWNRAREREQEPPEVGSLRSRRREAFGATLTSEPASVPTTHQPSLQGVREDDSDVPPAVDPIVAERHTAFVARVHVLTSNSASAVPAIMSAIQSYRSSESGPRDLISTFFNVVNRDLDGTAGLISALMELLDEEDKRRVILASWNGFKIEQQREFPDLIPGSEYAGVAGGRVLTVKHSAAIRSSSTQSRRQVWDRVAQAAASSPSLPPPGSMIRTHDKFPTLAASRTTPALRQSHHNTAWSAASASSSSSSRTPTDAIAVRSALPSAPSAAPPRTGPPQISATLFPTLPSSGSNIHHSRPTVSGNQSLKHILGDTSLPASNPWVATRSVDVKPTPAPMGAESGADPQQDMGNSKGKKKKGKEKQTLFTFGTFPT